MYILIGLFLGFVIVLVIYYLWRGYEGSDREFQPSVKTLQSVGEEKRSQPRVDIHWPVSMETSGGTIEAEVTNISLGGAFIRCQKPLPIGEVFPLTMMGPENEPLAATAKVVWSNVNVPQDKVVNRGMGVRFIKMSDRHIQLVKKIVQESD